MIHLGEISFYIKDWCTVGDARKTKKDELTKRSDRCLEFANLCCDLSVIRQLLLTDMASLLAEAGLHGVQDVLLKLIKQEQEADRKLLMVLEDPTNHM